MNAAKSSSTSPPSSPLDMDRSCTPDHSVRQATTRFQLTFPRAFERLFAPFDDAIVALCQRRTTGAVLFFSTVFTFFTSIEVSLIAPPTLFALGYDQAAGLCGSVLLVLGIVSQVPKKFIFRPRPWMVSRALPVRRDKTSSFPSRAVVCAVVFSWLIAWSAAREGILAAPLPTLPLWVAILCVAALTAFARINVGAHYPSDTVLGFLLGCVVVRIGTRLEDAWRAACDPSVAYSTADHVTSISRTALLVQLVLSRGFLVVTVLSYLMTLVSIQGFWVKCSYVYGLLMSSAAFRATYLCSPLPPSASGVSHIVEHGSLSRHMKAAAPFAFLLLFGMITRGRKGPFRVVAFTLIYLGALIAMLTWRLQTDWTISGGR